MRLDLKKICDRKLIDLIFMQYISIECFKLKERSIKNTSMKISEVIINNL